MDHKVYIYMRVSTNDQSHEAQLAKLLRRFPDGRMYEETASGIKKRPILNALIESMGEGDTLAIYSLDRLGRKTVDVLAMIESLVERGINLVSLREGVDYSTPVGKLVTQILVSVAEMEREMISERTKAGLAAARERGKKINGEPHISMGRPSKIPKETILAALSMVAKGDSVPKVSKATGISISYIRKLIKKQSGMASVA